jgi:hypothetical protein
VSGEGGVIGNAMPPAFDVGQRVEVKHQCTEGIHVGAEW